MRKRKHFYTVISLIAGVIILTTAAAANYGNANGYTAYKSALKDLLYADNFSARLGIELIYNGETQAAVETVHRIDKDGKVVEHTAHKERTKYGYEHTYSSESWIVRDDDNEENEPAFLRIGKSDDIWTIYRTYYSGYSGLNDDEVTRKAVRFAELIADMFVGDIKNNFVLTSSQDGVKSYQVILSGNQLPEYVTAGISMLYSAARQESKNFVVYSPELDLDTEEMGRITDEAWRKLADNLNRGVVYVDKDGSLIYFTTEDLYYESEYYRPDSSNIDNFLRMLVTEPVVESAKCFITLDAEGRLIDNILEGTLAAYDKDGNRHTISLRISADIWDYGTTSIDMPVIPESDTVYDYSKSSHEDGVIYALTKNGITTIVTRDDIVKEVSDPAAGDDGIPEETP